MPDTNFAAIAHKWQKKWDKAKLYETEPDTREKFFITNPYPYISGSLHIGHARVVTETDVYARFMRMRGKNTLYPMAFHISGTPVLGISLAIANGDKKQIELYTGYVRNYVTNEKEVKKIMDSFKNPQNVVDFFIPKMREEFSRLGLSIDWRRSFNSGEPMHQKMVEWLFYKYKEKKYIIQGKYPVLYSLTLRNAVGEDDIKEGDTSLVEKQEFTLIKFRYGKTGKEYLVAATLRPETMYGQTNMWVNPDVTYVKANVDDEVWHVSKECAEKLEYQDHTVKIIEEVSGREYLGKTCFAPFIEREMPILPLSFCNPDIGTGIVTSVPGHAPVDYIRLTEMQHDKQIADKYGLDHAMIKKIKIVPILKTEKYGENAALAVIKKFGITSSAQEDKLREAILEIYKTEHHTGILLDNCGPFSGMSVAKAKEAMKENLLKENRGAIFFETTRLAQSRDGGKVIVAILDNQWFIDFNAKGWRELAHTCLDKMNITPEKYRKQFEDVFAWLDKRPCARLRGLGTKLPFDTNWVIESLSDSVIYMTLYPIAHLLREFNITPEQMSLAFFDYVYNGEGSEKDVAKKTSIPVDKLHALRASFDYWYPNDHRHTFNAHLSNHLSFMIFAHVASLNKKYWPKKISFHGMIISEGTKMSKSKGNTITLLEIDEKYGADVFRAFMCTVTSVESTFNWETEKVEHMKRHLMNLYETLTTATQHIKIGKVPSHLNWFISQFERAKQRATDALTHMDLRTYATTVLYDILSAYKEVSKSCTDEEFHTLNNHILKDWIIMLSPVTPHIAEELWQQIRGRGFVSVHSWLKVQMNVINPVEEFKHQLMLRINDDVTAVNQLAKIDAPHRITLIVSPIWKYELFELLKQNMARTFDQKALTAAVMGTHLKKYGAEVMKIIASIVKDTSKMPELILSQDDEYTILMHASKDLGKTHGSKIIVERAEESTQSKAKNAAPAKPAIVIE